MSMPPWVSEQLVKDRMAERQRTASAHRRPAIGFSGPAPAPSMPSGRRRPSHLIGELLITAGRRLAGPDALAAALDRPRVGRRGHSHA
jgi:hypothetical protein